MRMALALVLLTSVFSPAGRPAIAQSAAILEVLADVFQPFGGVIAGPDGALYGTSRSGLGNCGYVYRLDAQNQLGVLHEFPTGGAGGCDPRGELVVGADGALYGTTYSGGLNSTGTVYRITTAGDHSVVHAFAPLSGSAYPEGFGPAAGLTRGPDDALYGMASAGGTGDRGPYTLGPGTIFRVDPSAPSSSRLTVLRHLSASTDGGNPQGGLTLASDGSFYGTLKGGGSGVGTLFRVTPAGVFSRVYGFPFDGCNLGCMGANPIAAPLEADGGFYALARDAGPGQPGVLPGQGTIVRVVPNGTPNGVATLVHGFSGPDGATPDTALTLGGDGSLYSVTLSGGLADRGTIFRVDTAGIVSTVHHFTAPYGINPHGRLLATSPGVLIGTASSGGPSGGVIFRLSFPRQNTVPTAEDGAVTTDEDTPVSGRLIGLDAENEALSYAIVSSGQHGMATVDPDYGSFQYVPQLDFFGSDSFTFTVNDGTATSELGTMTVTVNPVNDPPVANAGPDAGVEGTSLAGTAVTLDGRGSFDVDGDTLTYTWTGPFGTATGATAVVALPYGLTVATLTVGDGQTASTDTVNISVQDTIAPAISCPAEVVAAATSPSGAIVAYPEATATDIRPVSVTYLPPSGSLLPVGVTLVTATATDDYGNAASCTFAVTVTPFNQPPAALAGVVAATEGTAVNGTLQATNPEASGLAFSVTAQPTQGTVTITNASTGAFTYTPGPGAIGYDAFTFQVSDGAAMSTATQMVFIVADSPRWPGQTVRASVGAGGAQGATFSACSSTSADGRFVAFHSEAPFVPADTNARSDVFVHDRQTGDTTRVSVSSSGTQSNGNSQCPVLSADGRYVGFESVASNLIGGDTNGGWDLFRHDRHTGQTVRVSVASGGGQVSPLSTLGGVLAMSGDGRTIAFPSFASNVVPGDTNGTTDVFVHEVDTLTTILVTVATDGSQTNGFSRSVSMSADGRFVAFSSQATNLVPADTNAAEDVFVRDLFLNETRLVSASSSGAQASAYSQLPQIAAIGRYVLFQSGATNLVAGAGPGNLYVHNLASGSTSLVSVATNGAIGNDVSGQDVRGSSISADGRFIAFLSRATNLVDGDTNGREDVFVRDLLASTTTRVSLAGDRAEATDVSWAVVMSQDSRFITFDSSAANLVAGDTNGAIDVFVVGGVSITPIADAFSSSGGTGSVAVAFVFPGTTWGASSSESWLTVTGQSSTNGNGTVSFEAAPNPGPARTGTLIVAAQTVTVTQAANAAPTAEDGGIGTLEDTPVGGVLTGADPDGTPLTFSLVSNGTRGTTVITDAASGAYTYTPDPNAFGDDAFTFTVTDGSQTSNVATVTVSIQAINDEPVAQPGSFDLLEDVPAGGTLSGSDVDGGTLTFSMVSSGTLGTASITNPATGAYTYTPNANASGTDTFTFRVSDGSLESNIADVTVTVAPVNDAPVAQDGVLSVTAGTSASGALVATDVDGPSLSYVIESNGTRGTAVVTNAATGAFTYTANAGGSGSDTVTFRAGDGTADSNAATVTVTIAAGSNLPPIASASSITTLEDRSVGGTLTASDPERMRLTFSIASNPSRGIVTITNTATGRFRYLPNPNANGPDSFTFQANDGTSSSSVAVVSVTVTPVNDVPVAVGSAVGTTRNQPVNGILRATDVDGDVLTFRIARAPTRGTVSIVDANTGAFVYTPATNFTGSDWFTFLARDGSTNSAAATVRVAVSP